MRDRNAPWETPHHPAECQSVALTVDVFEADAAAGGSRRSAESPLREGCRSPPPTDWCAPSSTEGTCVNCLIGNMPWARGSSPWWSRRRDARGLRASAPCRARAELGESVNIAVLDRAA